MRTLLVTFIFVAVDVSMGASATKGNSTRPGPLGHVLLPDEFMKSIKELVNQGAKYIGASDTAVKKVIEIIDAELPASVFNPLFNQTKGIVERIVNRVTTAVIIDKSFPEKDVTIIRAAANKVVAAVQSVLDVKH